MRTKVAFTLPAPAGAPEVKGPRMYFRPQRVEWSIATDYIGALYVTATASGPATRTDRPNWGEKGWMVPGDLPDWIDVPHEQIAVARRTIAFIEALGVCDE